ncbi:hypothetical protein IAE22_34310, partial [Bacillus sp. S34]|nr:hypothetical protein [Bacillus sp. S34]
VEHIDSTVAALEESIDDTVAALVIEPIKGEAGVVDLPERGTIESLAIRPTRRR